jgi:hypothetical protein
MHAVCVVGNQPESWSPIRQSEAMRRPRRPGHALALGGLGYLNNPGPAVTTAGSRPNRPSPRPLSAWPTWRPPGTANNGSPSRTRRWRPRTGTSALFMAAFYSKVIAPAYQGLAPLAINRGPVRQRRERFFVVGNGLFAAIAFGAPRIRQSRNRPKSPDCRTKILHGVARSGPDTRAPTEATVLGIWPSIVEPSHAFCGNESLTLDLTRLGAYIRLCG